MMMKLLGAACILLSSGAFGYSLVRGIFQEEAMLRRLLHILRWMENELRYHLTPLPDLCILAGCQAGGKLRSILEDMAQALEQQLAPEAGGCMDIVLCKYSQLPLRTKRILSLMGSGLGQFDLAGQLDTLREVQAVCGEELDAVRSGREQCVKNCLTLSLCAGASLVILFI